MSTVPKSKKKIPFRTRWSSLTSVLRWNLGLDDWRVGLLDLFLRFPKALQSVQFERQVAQYGSLEAQEHALRVLIQQHVQRDPEDEL